METGDCSLTESLSFSLDSMPFYYHTNLHAQNAVPPSVDIQRCCSSCNPTSQPINSGLKLERFSSPSDSSCRENSVTNRDVSDTRILNDVECVHVFQQNFGGIGKDVGYLNTLTPSNICVHTKSVPCTVDRHCPGIKYIQQKSSLLVPLSGNISQRPHTRLGAEGSSSYMSKLHPNT